MDCSTPDFPVLHHLSELAETHVHQVGDAIQPSHPLLSPSPPALNLSQHQGLFQWVSSSQEVAKVLSFSFSISPSNVRFLKNVVPVSSVQLLSHVRLFVTLWTATPQASLSIINSWNLLKLMSIESVMPSNLIFCHPLLFPPLIFPQESPPTPQLKSVNSSALSFFYSPTLTSKHDYWKNHSFD